MTEKENKIDELKNDLIETLINYCNLLMETSEENDIQIFEN